MIEIQGRYGKCQIFTDNVDEATIKDVYKILNSEIAIDSNMKLMPDCHKGASFPIGTVMKINDKVIPNGVSVDIGCGMLVQKLNVKHVELLKLDKVIHQSVPSGFNVHQKSHRWAEDLDIDNLICKKYVNLGRAYNSLGTLGGGNHFIELNQDEEGYIYLVIHTGSRNLGKQIAEYYQQAAYDSMTNKKELVDELIKKLKAEGREKDIKAETAKIQITQVEKSMAYCTGQLFEDYMNDMRIAQEFALLNRKAIADIIQRGMGWKVVEEFQTIHNYIEMNTKTLRKGAVSAKAGEKLIIPMNMRDGSIICVGKGNEDWNESAPHGAGRIMSRSKAKESVTLTEYKESMEGIFTTCVTKDTIDESPMAYKPMQEIIDNIGDTVEILNIIKPLYNFKAGGE